MLETPSSRATVPSRAAWDRWRSRFLLLITDPDPDVADELASELARHHVDVEVCIGAADALVAAGTLRPDAVLVAAESGELTGAEVVQALVKRTKIPVVVGIGDGQGDQAGAALSCGATARVARPYRLNELIPIMKSIRPDRIGMVEPPIDCGALHLDPATLEVSLYGRSIRLPLREYELLCFLMIHADRVLTPDQIYSTVWAQPSGHRSNTLVVHIRRLRARLGDNQENPRIIADLWGIVEELRQRVLFLCGGERCRRDPRLVGWMSCQRRYFLDYGYELDNEEYPYLRFS
jgi:DNA-binding response OmpR family regulator